MRKLKLQMNITIDGFVGRENGELDWLTFEWGDKVQKFCIENLEPVDFIIGTFGKKIDPSFITYWDATAKNPDDPYVQLAKKISSTPKIVLTENPTDLEFPNTKIITGNIIDEVKRLKNQNGNKIMVYGGVTFASSLLENDLIDGFYFLVNPVTIGNGLSIFEGIDSRQDFELVTSETDASGIVINKYLKKVIDN